MSRKFVKVIGELATGFVVSLFTGSLLLFARAFAVGAGCSVPHVPFALLQDELQKDLERFARHGQRKTIQIEDVLLYSRRNEEMEEMLATYAREQLHWAGTNNKKKPRASKQDKSAAASAASHLENNNEHEDEALDGQACGDDD